MDAILYWNEVALEADRTTHTTRELAEAGSQGPVGASRALGIVHLAMHDAYFGINPKYDCYLPDLPEVPDGANADAAIGAAAHATLSALYPTQKAFFNERHAAQGLPAGTGTSDGHFFGLAVAEAILARRAGDPTVSDDGYSFLPVSPHHQPDPDNPGQGFHAPHYGDRAHLFAATTRHRIAAPPLPGNRDYERALRQVRSKGIAPALSGTLPPDLLPVRTGAETAVGLFWAYDGAKGLGTPPRLYNQIIRQVAAAQRNDVVDNARLFALVNAAMADAGILCWAEKYRHDLWRPVIGIRAHDSLNTGKPSGPSLGDPNWLPLGAPNSNNVGQKNFTPPFPAYPSGHATFGAAAFQSTRRFYRETSPGTDSLADDLEFVSEELNGITVDNVGTVRPRIVRRFPDGLWQMIIENGRSRVFLGVHWVFDAFAVDDAGKPDLRKNIGGVRLGMAIADDIAANGLDADAAAGPEPA